MMKLIFSLAVLAVVTQASTSCTYVPVDNCLYSWECDYHFGDEYYDGGTIASVGSHSDYDCEDNIAECPMDASDLFHGQVCEADAACYMSGGNPIQGVPCDLNDRPAGTSATEDNCFEKDVYKVQCTSTLDIADYDCSFVPVTECQKHWDCYYYEYDEADYNGGILDYDCGGIGQCPMVIDDMGYNGMICEADADGDGFTPAGTSSDENNCQNMDVYEIVCVAKAEPETTAPEATEDPASEPVACGEINDSSACDNTSYCRVKNDNSGSFKKCKPEKCKPMSEDACNEAYHCAPKYRKDGSFKVCKIDKSKKAKI